MLVILLASLISLSASAQSKASSDPRTQEAENLHQAGYRSFLERDYKKALEAFQKELPLRQAVNDPVGAGWALNQAQR
jgi:outer membrane protein assembly factor BamD (BamD/ComL family)